MADVIDNGADTAQLFLDMELRKQRSVGILMPFTGKCYNCGEEVEAPACFCNTDGRTECQEDYEKRARTHAKTHYAPVVS